MHFIILRSGNTQDLHNTPTSSSKHLIFLHLSFHSLYIHLLYPLLLIDGRRTGSQHTVGGPKQHKAILEPAHLGAHVYTNNTNTDVCTRNTHIHMCTKTTSKLIYLNMGAGAILINVWKKSIKRQSWFCGGEIVNIKSTGIKVKSDVSSIQQLPAQ